MSERKGRRVKQDGSFTVHPDQHEFFKRYRRGGPTMDEIMNERKRKLEQGEPIHNTDHDAELKETAKINTDNAITGRGWIFPSRR